MVLVTAVGSPAGINVLRALSESSRYVLIAADADPTTVELYMYQTERAVLPLAKYEKKYMAAISKLILSKNVSVILSCVEEEILVLARHRSRLEELGAKILVPEEAVVRRSCDKRLLARIAFENGIPSPKSCWLSQKDNRRNWKRVLRSFAEDCEFPWIIKPPVGHGMKGIVRAENLRAAIKAVQALGLEAVIQEFIPGQVGSMHLVGLLYNRHGDVIRSFASRSIRTLYPSGGPATAGISMALPELVEKTRRFVALVGKWNGPLCAEWMLDPRDNLFKLIEINPRLWGYGYLAVASGTNFPVTLIDIALGKDVGTDSGYKTGVMLMRSTYDVTLPSCPFNL